jgi:hypothetical protein
MGRRCAILHGLLGWYHSSGSFVSRLSISPGGKSCGRGHPGQRPRSDSSLWGGSPERGKECFSEATDRLKELAGDSVRVESGPRQGDVYGRLLFYVYTEEDASLDETLVREGLALAWLGDGQHRVVLGAAETDAERRGIGCLW